MEVEEHVVEEEAVGIAFIRRVSRILVLERRKARSGVRRTPVRTGMIHLITLAATCFSG